MCRNESWNYTALFAAYHCVESSQLRADQNEDVYCYNCFTHWHWVLILSRPWNPSSVSIWMGTVTVRFPGCVRTSHSGISMLIMLQCTNGQQMSGVLLSGLTAPVDERDVNHWKFIFTVCTEGYTSECQPAEQTLWLKPESRKLNWSCLTVCTVRSGHTCIYCVSLHLLIVLSGDVGD